MNTPFKRFELPIARAQTEIQNKYCSPYSSNKNNNQTLLDLQFSTCCLTLQDANFIDKKMSKSQLQNQCHLLIDESSENRSLTSKTMSCSKSAALAAIEELKDIFDFSPEALKFILSGDLGRMIGNEIYAATHGEETLFAKALKAFQLKYEAVWGCMNQEQQRDFFCKNLPTAISLLLPTQVLTAATKLGKGIKMVIPSKTVAIQRSLILAENMTKLHEKFDEIEQKNKAITDKIMSQRFTADWKNKEIDELKTKNIDNVAFQKNAADLENIYKKYTLGEPGNERATRVDFVSVFMLENPELKIKVNNSALSEVAQKYEKIYSDAGLKIKLTETKNPYLPSMTDSYQMEILGVNGKINTENSAQYEKLLTGLKTKVGVKSIVVNIDRHFFEANKFEAAFHDPSKNMISINAFGAQNPNILLGNSDVLFHEIRHANNDKLKNKGENRPINNLLEVDTNKYPYGTNHSLVSLKGYQNTFFTEEWDAYKKQFAIAKKASVNLPNFNTTSSDLLKTKRLTDIATSYQEAARSAVLNAEYAENYLKNDKNSLNIEFTQAKDTKTVVAKIPVLDENVNNSIGTMSITLADIAPSDSSAVKLQKLRNYINNMKNQSSIEFENAQSILQELANPEIPIENITATGRRP